MNSQYPYPIDFPEFIPTSEENAKYALNLLDEFKPDLNSTPQEVFLLGWFAIHFLQQAPHPNDLDDWPESLKVFCVEAFRRTNLELITEEHLYCSDAQQQGQRLQLDKNLNSYVIASTGKHTGYLSANYSQETGNQPCLTGIKGMAYIYENPKTAMFEANKLQLDEVKIYGGKPEEMLDCPAIIPVSIK